jgi:hypothetical protein
MGALEVIVEKKWGSLFCQQAKDGECRGKSRTASRLMLRAGKNAAWAMQIMWARSIEKVPITTIYDLPLIGETFQYVS